MSRTNRTRQPALAGFASLILSSVVFAQVDVDLSVAKSFRQYTNNDAEFLSGSFRIDVFDGSATYQPGCFGWRYFGPNPLIPCPQGATGFIGFGNLDPTLPNPPTYYEINGITPAIIFAPKHPDKCILHAAPKTDLNRPISGFVDNSYSIFYTIVPGSISIREYLITRYNYRRTYAGVAGGSRLRNEIVPGVYHFSFPKLGDPDRPVAVPITHYLMANGSEKIGNVRQGVQFVDLPGKFNRRDGFVRIDTNSIPVFNWRGLNRTNVFPSDRLYFSIRYLRNPNNPRSPQQGNLSIFPEVVAPGTDPRVLLANGLVSSYTLPPLVATGTRGIVELELLRNATTNSVTYDRSSRKFQLPVYFVDQYKQYRNINLGTSGPRRGLFQDFDGDGVNNITEWALGSRANDPTSVPTEPLVEFVPADFFTGMPSYFRIRQPVRDGLIPEVRYVFQRSTDNGETWRRFNGDGFWRRVNSPASPFFDPRFVTFVGGVFQEPDDFPADQAGVLYRVRARLAN